jgi:hypothetical protein
MGTCDRIDTPVIIAELISMLIESELQQIHERDLHSTISIQDEKRSDSGLFIECPQMRFLALPVWWNPQKRD